MTNHHQTQQQQQMQPFAPGPDYAERLVRNERDVAGLKDGLTALASTVDKGFLALTADLKSRSSINWAPISILVTLLGLIGSGFFAFLSSGQGRLEAMIAKQETRAERYVPREDLDARFAVLSQRRDDLQRLTDARVERIERDLDTVGKQVVPRGEHDTVRQLQQRDYDLLRSRIERVEGRFEKRADGFDREIDKLGDRTLSRSEALARNDAQDRAFGVLRTEVDEHVRAFNDRQQRRIDTLETPLLRSRP